MDLQNRENFLNKLAQRMGRPRQNVPEPIPVLENNHAITRLTNRPQPQLCQEFIDFARVMMADVVEAKRRIYHKPLLIFVKNMAGRV